MAKTPVAGGDLICEFSRFSSVFFEKKSIFYPRPQNSSDATIGLAPKLDSSEKVPKCLGSEKKLQIQVLDPKVVFVIGNVSYIGGKR